MYGPLTGRGRAAPRLIPYVVADLTTFGIVSCIYIYIYIHTRTHVIHILLYTHVCVYIYIYTICMFTPFGIVSKFKGNNLSNTTCLTQAFFKSGEECSEFW